MIFVQATKQKFRFPSNKGELTVEQLWDLPLQSRSGFDLDTVAKQVNASLKEVSEESFVSVVERPGHQRFQAMLDVVKFIIADKLKSLEDNQQRVEKAAKRERLMTILASKQDEELKTMSVEEINKQLDALK